MHLVSIFIGVNMRRLFVILISSLIAACYSIPQQSSVPTDMKAVRDYQQRVISKHTANSADQDNESLNQSDKRPKVKHYTLIVHPIVRPRIGLDYHHSIHNFNW